MSPFKNQLQRKTAAQGGGLGILGTKCRRRSFPRQTWWPLFRLRVAAKPSNSGKKRGIGFEVETIGDQVSLVTRKLDKSGDFTRWFRLSELSFRTV
jgi:hypothetical protein